MSVGYIYHTSVLNAHASARGTQITSYTCALAERRYDAYGLACDDRSIWSIANRARFGRTACTQVAAHRTRLVESFSSICSTSPAVAESKREKACHGNTARSAPGVNSTRQAAGRVKSVAHAGMRMQVRSVGGVQPFSDRFTRAGIRNLLQLGLVG